MMNMWWYKYIKCPNCGESGFEIYAIEKNKCIKCNLNYEIIENALSWPLYEIKNKNKFRLSNIINLLNPFASKLSPFKWIHDAKVEKYYERTINDLFLAKEWSDHYLKNIILEPNSLILDFGCGRGRNIGILNQLGFKVVGQEVFYHSWWKRLYQNGFQVIGGNDINFPWKNESFDLILVVGVLHYLSKKQLNEFFHGASNILKNNGNIIFLEANHKSKGNKYFQLPRLYSLEYIIKKSINYGFNITEVNYEGQNANFFPATNKIIKNVISSKRFNFLEIKNEELSNESSRLWCLKIQLQKN
jgi:SAM-dependent methyltransferase